MGEKLSAQDLVDMPTKEFEFEAVSVDERGEITNRRTHAARRFTEILNRETALEMVLIPAGRFLMGSHAHQGFDDEHPQHSVRVSPFLMGQFPVTQAQWRAVMGKDLPFRCRGTNRPADRVSFDNATAFCARLSERTRRAYRLPSEAEWEYACRARTTTPFCVGETITTDLANYVGEHLYRAERKGVYRHETTPAGTFPPNPFGLYDMHGNVWEWCADTWHDDYTGATTDGSAWESATGTLRVLRGGCWHDPPDLCRSAARLKHVHHEGEDLFGFRVALTSLEQHNARYPAPENGRSGSRSPRRRNHRQNPDLVPPLNSVTRLLTSKRPFA